MQTIFHAFEVDLNDWDLVDIGLYRSEADGLLGLAQYVLYDIAEEHADHFLSGDVGLPWGYPSEEEMATEKLNWRTASEWLRTHSPLDLVNWYRREFPDLELFLVSRDLRDETPRLDEGSLSRLGADDFRPENIHLRRASNLLPRL